MQPSPPLRFARRGAVAGAAARSLRMSVSVARSSPRCLCEQPSAVSLRSLFSLLLPSGCRPALGAAAPMIVSIMKNATTTVAMMTIAKSECVALSRLHDRREPAVRPPRSAPVTFAERLRHKHSCSMSSTPTESPHPARPKHAFP